MSENIDFKCAPVLLIGFNRPERLKAQVDRLRAVKPRALTVWGNVARRSHAARALGGWIVPFAHWVERWIPALFRI